MYTISEWDGKKRSGAKQEGKLEVQYKHPQVGEPENKARGINDSYILKDIAINLIVFVNNTL